MHSHVPVQRQLRPIHVDVTYMNLPNSSFFHGVRTGGLCLKKVKLTFQEVPSSSWALRSPSKTETAARGPKPRRGRRSFHLRPVWSGYQSSLPISLKPGVVESPPAAFFCGGPLLGRALRWFFPSNDIFIGTRLEERPDSFEPLISLTEVSFRRAGHYHTLEFLQKRFSTRPLPTSFTSETLLHYLFFLRLGCVCSI